MLPALGSLVETRPWHPTPQLHRGNQGARTEELSSKCKKPSQEWEVRGVQEPPHAFLGLAGASALLGCLLPGT